MLKIAKLIFLTSLTICFCLTSSCVYYNTFYNAKKYYNTAERENENLPPEQIKPQNYQRAIDTAAKVPELYPQSKYVDDALMLMGKCFYKTKMFPKAERKFLELITNYPQSEFLEEATLWYGKSLIENKSYDKANEVLTKLSAEALNRKFKREANFALGQLLFSEENYIQAANLYERMAEVEKEKKYRAEALFLAGNCYLKVQNYTSAIVVFKKASDLKVGPFKRRFEAKYNWAVSLRYSGDLEQAKKVLQSILKTQKFYQHFTTVQVELAEIDCQLGAVDKAVADLVKISETKPNTAESARAVYDLGNIYLTHFKDYQKADDYFKQVKGQKSDSPYADSASAYSKIITNWRNANNEIESLKRTIQADREKLQGKTDTVVVDTSLKIEEKQIRKLFEPEIETIVDSTLDSSQTMPDSALTTAPIPDSSDTLKISALDTAKIMDNIQKNLEALNIAMFQLAEILYSQLNNIDSSRIILQALADSAQYEIAAKSIYLLLNIYKTSGDSIKLDSLRSKLLNDFGDTVYANSVRKRVGLPLIESEVDSGKILFLRAESLYFKAKEAKSAYEIYAEVDSLFPSSPYSPKSLYAQAFIAQHAFAWDSVAMLLLQKLADKYPQDTLAVIAKRKTTIASVTKTTTSIQEDTTVFEGEEQIFNPEEVDSLPVCQIDSVGIKDLISANNLYPNRALMSRQNGLVILKIVVDKYGYVQDSEVIKEEPPNLGFGQPAQELLQYLRFSPGKVKNNPVSVRIEQKIYFTL
jgi:TonB family protein